ncbi:sugar nucleotide-binding protein [Nitrosopumilus sp. S4]
MKILTSGSMGLLGRQLKQIDPSIISTTRKELDVANRTSVLEQIKLHKPDVFLHLAAFTDNRKLENDPKKAIMDNIIGTSNVTISCLETKVRLVYISTDYVYSGKKGMYNEDDELLPVNKYAWSKLGGECAVRQYDNSLIIRTSIGPSSFPYDKAFVDMWTSKDTVGVIAPMILLAAKSNITGILNIGTKRKNMFNYASNLNKQVKKAIRNEFGNNIDFDTSLDLSKYNSLYGTNN